MITVTKTYMPSKKKYFKYVNDIYKSGRITNNGPLVRELEERLREYLGVKYIVLTANGTLALEVAYRVLEIKNFAITTPFSFVATTSSLVANGIHPIFVDINPNTLTIDVEKIEESITPHTTAIVPVHVFGNACEIEEIEKIAKKHNIKVIYDAAHAFSVKYKGRSIVNFGDISILSFHATKLFHTIEGGAVILNDESLIEKTKDMINFGFRGQYNIKDLGVNAKMNEFEAAMGLCMLDEIDVILEKRMEVGKRYEKSLKDYLEIPEKNKNSSQNYSYFPVIFKSEAQLLKVVKKLNENNVFPRRYFYPSLDTLKYIEPKQFMPISRNISRRILCLPIYPELEKKEQLKIIKIIKENL